ncbi:hypothetical protein Hte_000064 [Hypoxylon texense]
MPETAIAFIREVWGLQGVAYLFVGLRYYSRFANLGVRGLAWDDAIMLFALLTYTAESVMAHLVVAYWNGLANNDMTDAQRAALDPNSEEWRLRVNGSKTHVVVWKSHLPWRRKAVLLVMFSGGVLEMSFGILRCVSILTLGDVDAAQAGYWSIRESFVSTILTNMPMVYPLFRKFIEKTGSTLTRSKTANQGDSKGYKLGSTPGRSEHTGRRQKPSASVPNDTTWGSKENIVVEQQRTLTGSSDDNDTSLELPKHQAGIVSFAEGEAPGRMRSPGPNDGIVVTTEYTVTEIAPQGSRNYSRPEF